MGGILKRKILVGVFFSLFLAVASVFFSLFLIFPGVLVGFVLSGFFSGFVVLFGTILIL